MGDTETHTNADTITHPDVHTLGMLCLWDTQVAETLTGDPVNLLSHPMLGLRWTGNSSSEVRAVRQVAEFPRGLRAFGFSGRSAGQPGVTKKK